MSKLLDSIAIDWDVEQGKFTASAILHEDLLHKFEGQGPSIFNAMSDMMANIKMEYGDLSHVSIGCLTELAQGRRKALAKFMGIE